MKLYGLFGLLLAGTCLVSAPATAQNFPNKPVRIIVPYAPGGTADMLVRVVAKQLGANLGQSVFIDNRAGAAGMIGADVLAQSPPDGYTIGLLATPHAATPFVMKLPFDPKELRPVALVASVPGLLSVNASVPAQSLNDILALARAKPGQLTYGNPGSLSAGHLAMEMLKAQAKVDIVAVPYKGGAPALLDLLGGQIQMGISGPTAHLPNIKNGKLRPIATTGLKRSTAAPDVPTFAESGVPGFELNEWYGLFAPAKTPPELIARLNQEIIRAMAAPEVRASFTSVGAEPGATSPAEFNTFFRNEMDRIGKLVVSLGLKAD